MKIPVPCIDCLKLPVCRHKGYIRLIRCNDVLNMIYFNGKINLDQIDRNIKSVEDVIKPTSWMFKVSNTRRGSGAVVKIE